MYNSFAIPQFSKYLFGMIAYVSSLLLCILLAQIAFIDTEKDLKSILFSPPLSMSFSNTFLAIFFSFISPDKTKKNLYLVCLLPILVYILLLLNKPL